MELKDIIKKLRHEKNMSQAQLAETLGVGLSTVASWETGARFPSREALYALADLFNVDMDYLRGKTSLRQQVHLDADGAMMVALNQKEFELILQYRKAGEDDKRMVNRILEYAGRINSMMRNKTFHEHTGKEES